MAETYNAGVVTAYGAAVRGGYTGTYEEFCAEQAEFAENAAAVAQAKEDVETMQGQVEQVAAAFTDTTVPAAVTTVQEAGAAQVQAVQSEGTMQAAAVETVGAQQTAAVGAAGSDAVDAVEAAETAATDAVTAAQTAAVQAVQTESTTQQAAVQAKGAETIASIPEDYTALSDDVDDLKSAFSESTGNKEIIFTPGGFIPCAIETGIDINTPTLNQNYRYAVVPCVAGDLFTVSATGGASGRAWAWIDIDGNLIQNAPANNTVENKLLTAPENAAYLIINDANTATNSYIGNLARVTTEALVNATRAIPFVWEAGGLASANGSENSLNYRIRTQYVRVTEGDTIVLWFNSSTRVYVFKFYDSEVHAFSGYEEVTEPGNYVIPAGCKWIRLVIGPRVQETITTDFSANLFVGTTDLAESVFVTTVDGEEIPLTFTAGKYQMWNGLYTTTGDWGYSDNVQVLPGDYLRVVNAWAVDYRPIFFFDSDGVCLSTYDTTKNAQIAEFLIRVPAGASYCVLNTKFSARADTKMYRIRSKIGLHDLSSTAANETSNRTGNKLVKIFDKIKTAGPLFTLVDDDGRNLAQVSEFHRICTENGIVGCNALATKFIEDMTTQDRETFLTTLKGYENEGFENVLHCYNHDYWESNIKATTMTDDEIYAAVTSDIVTGIRQMRDLGFINWEHWIVPQGKTELPNVQKVARNLGFKAIYDVANNTFNRFVPRDGLFHRYNIPRMELYPTDTANPPLTLQLIKDQALQCKEEGGWLIVCTHFYQAGWATDDPTYSRVTDMIQYIMGLGFTNVTLSGGLSYWEDIYRMYGLF